MNKTTAVLLVFLIMAFAFFIGVMLGFANGIYEDQIRLCSFENNCFIVDIDDFFTKKQMDIIEKSFLNIGKVENISDADILDCFLNSEKQLYCMEINK